MPAACEITGKSLIFGNCVSHANNKTRRKFHVNLKRKNFYIAEIDGWILLRVSTRAMRTMRKNGVLPTLRSAYKKGTLAPHIEKLFRSLKLF